MNKSIPSNEVWFRSIYKDEMLASFSYSTEILNSLIFFIENGYLIIDNAIEHSIFDHIIQAKNIPYEGEKDQPLRALHAWRNNNDVKAIAVNQNIIAWIERLYQRKTFPFLTTNFKFGSQVAPHTDAIKYQSFPEGFMCAAWTALEDTDEQNGVIELYPKSHLLPYIYLDKLDLMASSAPNRYAYYGEYLSYLQAQIEHYKLDKIQVPIQRGQTILWDSNLIHAGSKILDNTRTRYSQVTHYYFEDCMYYAPLFSDIPLASIYYWNVENICTQQEMPHTYKGNIVPLKNTIFKKMRHDLY